MRKVYTRLHPNNINRDSGIEISEAWMPTIKKHNNRRLLREQPTGTARIEMHQSQLLNTNQSQRNIVLYKVSRMPTIEKNNNSTTVRERTSEGTTHRNSEHQSQLLKTNQSQRSILRPHRLMKTSNMESKRRGLHPK